MVWPMRSLIPPFSDSYSLSLSNRRTFVSSATSGTSQIESYTTRCRQYIIVHAFRNLWSKICVLWVLPTADPGLPHCQESWDLSPFIPLSSPLYPSLITPLSLLDSLYGMTRETMTRVALKITILIMAKVVSTSSQQEYLGTISSSLRIELISPLHLSPPRFHIRCLRIRGSLRSMLPTIPHWYVRTYDTSAILLAYCQEYFFLFSSWFPSGYWTTSSFFFLFMSIFFIFLFYHHFLFLFFFLEDPMKMICWRFYLFPYYFLIISSLIFLVINYHNFSLIFIR